ncbi:MAG: HEAT repeat domain-containing protein [Elusimicrobiales bacterium]|nr:HEAT repeat domain-containing protein [Elusimicrobiales bacterium]
MFLTRLTSSPDFYTFLYFAVFLLAALNISEIVFLLVHKRSIESSEAKKELLKHRILTAAVTVTEPAEILERPRDSAEYEAYGEATSSIIESFEGEIAERASRLITEFGIDRYYIRLASNQIWYKRAHAIDILSSLKLKTNRDFFFSAFEKENSNTVKYRILYGLSLLVQGKEDLYAVSKMLSSLPYLTAKYTEDVFFNIVTALKNSGLEEDFGSFLREIMNDAGIIVKVKRDCLSACRAAACDKAGPVVREYYAAFQSEPEIIISCIKTLVGMGDFDVLPEVLRHKDWRVRLTALKYAHLSDSDIKEDSKTLLHDPNHHFAVLPSILRHKDWRARLTDLRNAHLHSTEILRALKSLLHDGNYHIRLNAALALSRMGDRGLEILKEETASPDKFAADAARYALDGAKTAS